MNYRCYDEAKKDYRMLHDEHRPDLLTGAIITKVYQEDKTPYVIIGIVVEDKNQEQHLITPTCPEGRIRKDDQGWLNMHLCHIPIHEIDKRIAHIDHEIEELQAIKERLQRG